MDVVQGPPPVINPEVLSGGDRPAGLHLSDVIKDILVTLKPDVYGQPFVASKILLGIAFERTLEAGFQVDGGSFRPDPIQCDGIWCSPDHVALDPWRVREFKATWYSGGKDCPHDEVFWPWLVQIKSYCYVTGTTLAELWVWFVNGNYKPPKPEPVPRVYQVTFTPLELQENWAMIVRHAQARGWL